jgi:hypothetical protein
MPRHVLYAYVYGSDLDEIADALDSQFVAFVAGRQWVAGKAWAVNQRQAQSSSDLPDWDLGLNLELPDPGAEPRDWFNDVVAVAQFLGQLNAEYDRDFVIGIADSTTGVAEDLFDVSTPSPNMMALKAIIGVNDPE